MLVMFIVDQIMLFMVINLLHSWLILITFVVKVTIMVDYFIYGWNLHSSLPYPIFDLLSHLLFVATGKRSLRA